MRELQRTSNRLGRTSLACRDHDQKLHHAVIDLAAATLDDVDILVPYRGVDVHAGLTIGEFTKVCFSGRRPQPFADSICEAGVRIARENLHTPHGGWD